jgi:hypothetical protein
MAVGAGFGGLIPVALTLVGIVTMLRARRNRRSGETPPDDEFDRRQRAAAEMERRMASYLAQRDMGDRYRPPEDKTEQETRR